MDPNESTQKPSVVLPGKSRPQRAPGLVHVFTAGVPAARAIAIDKGEVDLGRGMDTLGDRTDPRMSRKHARVRRDGKRFVVMDLGSQNGTFADGEQVPEGTTREIERVLRLGDSLFVPTQDVAALDRMGVREIDGFVRGPAMQQALLEAAHAAGLGLTLHIHGESGSGKEGVARAYHAATSQADGPFIAVNCASIPPGIAERLLFGAKRGAYSGADADAPGYFQSADGGTLFLDEVVELDLAVQAKLLRTIETREVHALGSTQARKVLFNLCSATHQGLRGLVAAGKLREDLYFRIGRPEVFLPPLRQRPEEIPFLLARALSETAPGLALHISLVETCLLRPWPGNVRELLVEARTAAQKAVLQKAQRVEASHLDPSVGTAFGATSASAAASPSPVKNPPFETRASKPLDPTTRAKILEALQKNGGKVATAARALGIHRTQLRRLLEQHNIVSDETDDGGEGD